MRHENRHAATVGAVLLAVVLVSFVALKSHINFFPLEIFSSDFGQTSDTSEFRFQKEIGQLFILLLWYFLINILSISASFKLFCDNWFCVFRNVHPSFLIIYTRETFSFKQTSYRQNVISFVHRTNRLAIPESFIWSCCCCALMADCSSWVADAVNVEIRGNFSSKMNSLYWFISVLN